MKKSGLLSLIRNWKAQAEQDPEFRRIVGLQILDGLLDYLNDPEIREAIEDVPFVEVYDESGNTSSEKLS